MKKLKIKPGDNLKVKTDFGEVVVSAIKSPHEPHPGIIFIPMGLWASQVMDPNSDNTGMPTMKGLKATVAATEEEVLDVKAILEKIRES